MNALGDGMQRGETSKITVFERTLDLSLEELVGQLYGDVREHHRRATRIEFYGVPDVATVRAGLALASQDGAKWNELSVPSIVELEPGRVACLLPIGS